MAKSFFQKARIFFAALGLLYAVIIVLLTVPYFQAHAIFMNAIRIPWGADFNAPEKYGLAPNKTFNLYLHTPDNETIGAWFILSDDYYHSTTPSNSTDHIPIALARNPTILFLHGNAGTRAFSRRVQHYSMFSSRLHTNVLAVDYRGFADSTGTPTEQGVVTDARTAWNWLIDQGAKPEDIIIIGHSLGTGIGGRLAANLSNESIPYRGLVLLSPFSSISELLSTYHIFGLVPLVKPLSIIPSAARFITWALIHKFETLTAVPEIKGPVIIAHAENDWDIPYTHSAILFDAFLAPRLPQNGLPKNLASVSYDEWSEFSKKMEEVREVRGGIVSSHIIPNFGKIEEFEDGGRMVTYIQTLEGKHDEIANQEGLQDAIGQTFGLFRRL